MYTVSCTTVITSVQNAMYTCSLHTCSLEGHCVTEHVQSVRCGIANTEHLCSCRTRQRLVLAMTTHACVTYVYKDKHKDWTLG